MHPSFLYIKIFGCYIYYLYTHYSELRVCERAYITHNERFCERLWERFRS